MNIEATTKAPLESGADTIAVGVFDGEDIAHDVADGTLQRLLDSGEARRAFKHLAVAHAEGRRWIVVGLGDRARFDGDRARVAAAAVHARARELSAAALCWEVPHHLDDTRVAALVEGTVLAGYRFDRYRNHPEEDGALERLVVSAHHPIDATVEAAAVVAAAQNRARDLQNTPSNELTPERLAHRAQELVAEADGLSLEVRGEEEIGALGMGAFAAVARGSEQDARLIELRYDGPGADSAGPLLALVGKAVTFDTGGISIKPAMRMSEMKFDMSGGAAVLEAIGAIARLRLPIRVLGVIGATENMPSGRAVKPGDIVRASNGTTIEVVNTDAEGRLVLADCLAHAVNHGAQRIVDVATLTGAIVTTFGASHAGLIANDDEWAAAVEAAGRASGELVWRLPLHSDYADAIKGRYADVVNSTENRKAASITAGEFLRRFVGEVPWAHLDIAGTANDTGRQPTPSGGSGYGVRLLVELARRLAA
ncbi:leucyl aminopeptidase family protein [Conexibacter arvalis]|uniref:Probable cytosol aminopeptidase n=1 Tax=Conexibacter arvalis TaxID=912552 RepID=A0A840IKD8_9ACTN|nr:leucyl aminopeptidase [Conexibacter arvalis]MBB4664390.1 leucyl aminopeptidase [Conexibacter arvalis]